jgi:hypothetical protein
MGLLPRSNALGLGFHRHLLAVPYVKRRAVGTVGFDWVESACVIDAWWVVGLGEL